MEKEVKFSLVFRDMWQSAGKYVPRIDQLVKVAPAIIEMGCFARVETNGGGFEQVNLLFGENPNKAVRACREKCRAGSIPSASASNAPAQHRQGIRKPQFPRARALPPIIVVCYYSIMWSIFTI